MVLLFDPQIRAEKIYQRAKELAKSPKDVKRLRRRITDTLNQYWAEGSVEGSVTPHTSRCGGRGKEKKQGAKKIGAKNWPTKSGQTGLEGYILSDEEKEQCGFAWRNYYIRGKTLGKAYWCSVTREPTVSPQAPAQVSAAQKGESKEDEIKKKSPAKAPKSGRAKFKAEQTRQKNQDAKRNELLKTLPDGDIRSSGLVAHHLKGFQDALATARGAA